MKKVMHQLKLQKENKTTSNGVKNLQNEKGISIIELLTVIAIILVALTSLLGVAAYSLRSSILIQETTQANNLAQETIEAARNFRDGINWNNDDPNNEYDGLGVVSTGTAYHLEKSSDSPPKWKLILVQETIDGFTRKVVFEKVSRDPATDNIETTYNPANNDPNTKKLTATVAWKDKKVEIITYLTNWKQ